MSEVRSHYPMPDDAAPQRCDIWEEAPLPKDDADAAARRERVRRVIFQGFLGSATARHEGRPLPFLKVPDEALDLMPEGLAADYEAELASAQDRRSGRRVPQTG